MRGISVKYIFFFTCCLALSVVGYSQRFLSDYDSTLFIKDTLRPLIMRLGNLRFSGYIQPQFQMAQQKGEFTYEGGAFADSSASRFLVRQARVRIDYLLPAKGRNSPLALFTFQVDATERGVAARDVSMRLFDPKGQKLSLTMGLFARPFGYELTFSSAVRESPERGRMSQILMPGERDLGAMVSYESKKDTIKPLFKFDAGVFNGPGATSTTDFDSYKDIISRATLRPYSIGKNFAVSGGLSLLYGGWLQVTKYKYQLREVNNVKLFIVDSSLSNAGARAPRHYYGADVQFVYKHGWGKTEVRAEYWKGSQPGTVATTVNPGVLPRGPTYLRKFDGAFLYFIQSIINERWEAVVKYDWYDPNTAVSGKEISATNLTVADIKFSTLGFGFAHYFAPSLKALAYYNLVTNEQTLLPSYINDLPDNNFTFRMQLRF